MPCPTTNARYWSLNAVALNRQLAQIHTRLERQGVLADVRPAPMSMPTRLRSRSRSAWVVAGVVGLLVLGLGLYRASQPTRAEALFVACYQPEPVSRGKTGCDPGLAPGIRAYRAGAFGAALADFDKLPTDQPCVRYYRGIAQLALDGGPSAVAELEQATSPQPAQDKLTTQKADWYLALAYLKTNQPDKARQRLAAIVRQPGHPFATVARRALTDLDHA
jgi:hypothetical protein